MPIDNITDLNAAAVTLVKAVTKLAKVIHAGQDKSPPTGLYGTVKVIPVKAIGHTRKERTSTPAEEEGPTVDWTDYAEQTITQMHVILSVNCIGSGSRDAIAKVYNADYREPVRKILTDNSITWIGSSDVRDLTGIYQAKIQQRYQVDINVVVETQITDTVLRANGYGLEIQGESGNILTDEEY